MNIIKFAHNWNNKLNNNIFTTIRKTDSRKYAYYSSQMGNEFGIFLNGESYGKAILSHITKTSINNIPYELLAVDTGLISTNDIKELFRNFRITEHNDIIILTFKRI